MIVTLKGEAKDVISGLAGIYVLQPKPVNGKSHWLQDTGTHSIWYNREVKIWAIGPHVYLGSSTASMVSYDDVTGPEEATNWQYYNENSYTKWITSDDINVEAGTYSNYTTFNLTAGGSEKQRSNHRPDYALNFTTEVTYLVQFQLFFWNFQQI